MLFTRSRRAEIMLVQCPDCCLQVLHGELAPVPDPPCRLPCMLHVSRGATVNVRHLLCMAAVVDLTHA